MAWVRIEPEMIDHPKIIGLSDAAFALHVRAICYCNRHLTDGEVPAPALAKLGRRRAAAELVSAGLWLQEESGNYHIHDYLEYQPSRRTVHERREGLSDRRAEAGRKGAAKRWHADSNRDGKQPSDQNGKCHASEWQTHGPDPDPVERSTPLTPQRQRFEEWWRLYPRKVAKQQAWRMWERVKPDDVAFAKMLATLALQVTSVDWMRDGGKFIPHPSTYLHQGRYEDDVSDSVMLPPALEAYGQMAQWDWCEACDDAHEVGKCPKTAKAS